METLTAPPSARPGVVARALVRLCVARDGGGERRKIESEPVAGTGPVQPPTAPTPTQPESA